MPDGKYPDPREEDIVYGDRRISRPDVSLPDWEMPDTAYRPIPIVWFTGAMLAELLILGALSLIMLTFNVWITILTCVLATLAVGLWTWNRGMSSAGSGWKAATVIMLAIQLAFAILAAAPRL